ncbi:MAG: pirin family protein [Methanomassiliicoccales archaeon]|nr:MAG: pirin family protein [Methanomassiliicoccales archaeon]
MKVLESRPTIEGAGVNLKRVFGYYEVPQFDPFLLLDHFGSDNPADYLAGFPWHPHRGIETVTYMISGEVEHGDSIGNKGVIKSGDVQWMTAGGGIIHQEMPKRFEGFMRGFQLWVNLPSSQKMMGPRYRDIRSDQIPEVTAEPGVKVKIVSGEMLNTKGPVQDLVIDIEYFDVSIEPDASFTHKLKDGFNAFCYVFEGLGNFQNEKISREHAVLFKGVDSVKVESGKTPLRYLFVSGKPIGEPVAWRGPIVMNTQEELGLAFYEYRNGTFIK